MTIDWDNKKSNISAHFTVHDATFLPSWRCYHNPSEEEKVAIVATAARLEKVREVLGKQLNVHCWIRPTCVDNGTSYNGRNYNSFVGGAKNSAHITGDAVDFNPIGMTCGDGRAILVTELDEMQIRMENREGNWIHIDTRQPPKGSPRFFRP